MRLADGFVTDVGFRPEPWRIAVALAGRGWRVRLHTSAYFGRDALLVRAAKLLPPTSRDRAIGFLLRRDEPELDGCRALDRCRVVSWIFPDLLRRGLRRFRVTEEQVIFLSNLSFDRVAALLIPRNTSVVVAMQGTALATIRRGRRLGAKTVVVANSPDALSEHKLVCAEEDRLELERRPVACAAVERLARRIGRELREADLVLVNSEFSRRDLVAYGLPVGKVVVASLGVDLDRFSPGVRRGGSGRIVYVGSVQPRKGVLYLARAVEGLRAEGSTCALHVYGSGEGDYVRLLESFVASGTLELHGFVPHSRIAGVLRDADVFAFPTLSDGFGLVVYEAMACGVPVVATDRCGAALKDGVNALVVRHGDAAALKEALRRLLDDPALAASLAAAALETARASSWEQYRMVVASAIETLTGRPFPRQTAAVEAAS